MVDQDTTHRCGGKERRRWCEHAEMAAKAAVRETFAILGVDVESPKDVEEFRKSLRFGDMLRRGADKGFVAFLLALVALGFAAMVAGIKIKAGGG